MGKGQTGLLGGVALETSLCRETKKRGSPLTGSEDGGVALRASVVTVAGYMWQRVSHLGSG